MEDLRLAFGELAALSDVRFEVALGAVSRPSAPTARQTRR